MRKSTNRLDKKAQQFFPGLFLSSATINSIRQCYLFFQRNFTEIGTPFSYH